MAAARVGTMVVRTGKRSSWRGSRGRNQARRGSGSDDTSDEDYRLGADGEEDVVSSEDEEDGVGELEVSDDEEGGCEPEEEETSSEGSDLGDEEDEDFVINPVRRRKRKPTPKKRRKGGRTPAKKRRSGVVPRVCCEEETKPQRRVRKRRTFGGVDEDEEAEDGDDVDFSPGDEEEEDDFDDEELEDEGEDEEEEDLEDEDEEDESNDEEDEVSVKRKKGPTNNQRGGKKRKTNARRRRKSGLTKRKRSKANPMAKKRRNMLVSSGDDEDDEDFVVEDEELIDEEEEEEEEVVETGRNRKADRSGGANARRARLALEYDSADSYSSGFDDTVPDREAGRIVGLVQRPRTGWGVRSIQAEPNKGKGKAAKAEQDEEDPPEKRICGVCLSEERNGHILGLLNSCAHFFCFTCILEWSKVESRCPVCKQRFTAITKASGSDLAIQLRPIVVNVPKRDQVYQPSEEEVRGYLDPYANVVCIECLQGGEDTLMLLCDICNSAAHTYCVGLGREVPEGDWYCDACRSADVAQPNVQGEEGENQRQQVPNAPELQPCQHSSTRTGRVEIDMNLPYIPSPERPPPETFADESSYLRMADLPQSAQVHSHEDATGAGRASRSVRQSASTVSERRALRQRIQIMFSNNWLNVNQIRQPPESEQPVLFNDLNTLTRDFL